MVDLGAAVLALAAQVVKRACHLWLGDGFAGDAADSVADLLKDQVPDAIQRHKLKGMFEGFAVTVAEKTRQTTNPHFRALPENEREAAVLAVAETFERARLTDASLFAANLDARELERHLRQYVNQRASAWGLGSHAAMYFDFLLRECCSYLLEVKKALPPFTTQALTELLKRSSAVELQLAEILDRIPVRTGMTGDDGFETDYRRQLIGELDYMELFGASVFERQQGYQLSVAYISLLVDDGRGACADPTRHGVAVEKVLSESRRIVVRGEAGSGKTTLLQWLALSAARHSFEGVLADWNNLVPFFIRLRQFAADGRPLPQPADFLRDGVAASLHDLMPPAWTDRVLGAGRGLVLVDGVDEVPESQRRDVAEWLRVLAMRYPDSRFIVTSRPAAAAEDWLAQQGFGHCFVQPMTLADVREFVGHWHDAVAATLVEGAAKAELSRLATGLIDKVYVGHHLRQLATNPLMCALMCALHRDRRATLPKNRIELYRISLEMFLQRRDSERGMAPSRLTMEYDDKLKLLQDLAYWMMKNELAAADRERVIARLDAALDRRRHHVAATAGDVLDHLLERSGVLREPVAGSIDFVHRSFQEFLAAQAVVDADDVESLLARAANDQWRQVVILAAGLAKPAQTAQIFKGLLSPPRKLRRDRMLLSLIALSCMETASDVDPPIVEQIKKATQGLVPPRTTTDIAELVKVGEFAVELISEATIADHRTAESAYRVAARIGGPSALSFVERLSKQAIPGYDPLPVLLSIWESFDPIEFADRVLAGHRAYHVTLSTELLIPALERFGSFKSLSCFLKPPYSDYTFLARLPELDHVEVALLPDPPPIRLALPADARCTLTAPVQIGRGTDMRPGISIVGLSARRILTADAILSTTGRISIFKDPELTDLTGLVLPSGTALLEIVNCPLRSLNGLAHPPFGRVRKLNISNPALDFQPFTGEMIEEYVYWSKLIGGLDHISISIDRPTATHGMRIAQHELDAVGLITKLTVQDGRGVLTATRPGAASPTG